MAAGVAVTNTVEGRCGGQCRVYLRIVVLHAVAKAGWCRFTGHGRQSLIPQEQDAAAAVGPPERRVGEVAARIADADDDPRTAPSGRAGVDQVSAAFDQRKVQFQVHGAGCLDAFDLGNGSQRCDLVQGDGAGDHVARDRSHGQAGLGQLGGLAGKLCQHRDHVGRLRGLWFAAAACQGFDAEAFSAGFGIAGLLELRDAAVEQKLQLRVQLAHNSTPMNG